MLNFLTLDNVDVEGKILCVRVDLNSPIVDKKIVLSQRLVKTCNFLEELISKKAKIVLIAHQGRKNGRDFVSLRQHKDLIEREIKTKIKFHKDIFNETIEKDIKNLKSSKIILLENLRFFDDEINFKGIKKEDNKIQKLAKICDYYVLDCFSVSHRNHYSISQIDKKICISGRNLEEELKHLKKLDNTKSPHIYILGGNKPDDLLDLIEKSFERKSVDKILLTGVIGELALISQEYNLGKKGQGLIKEYFHEIEKLKELISKNSKKIFFPNDVALFNGSERVEIPVENLNNSQNKELLEKFETFDIGNLTINNYENIISKSNSIYLKGPCGNFEDKHFEKGTKEIFSFVSKNSKNFSFMGGGHTTTAAKMFNLLEKFDYVSLAGGALIKYIEKEKLYGVEMLQKSFEEHKDKVYDFIVCGSTCLDIKVDVPTKFNQIELGSKVRVGDGIRFGIGGGGFNMSLVLSKLKTKVGLLSKLSREFKEMILDEVQKNKLDLIKVVDSKKSLAKSILVQTKDKDRVIFSSKGQNADLEITDIKSSDLKSNNFLFSLLVGKSFKFQKAVISKIKRYNKNSNVALVLSSGIKKEKLKPIKDLIKKVDVLICNFDEAKYLLEKREINECLKDFNEIGVRTIIITDGAQGSYAFSEDINYYEKARPPKRVVDTTGAGDCFAATFFYFYSKKYNIQRCLYLASKNSSNFISKNGTQNGLLEFDEIVSKNKV